MGVNTDIYTCTAIKSKNKINSNAIENTRVSFLCDSLFLDFSPRHPTDAFNVA